jgi:hypothetical protein
MPTSRINNRKDILLLLLYSPGKSDEFNEPIIGRTRLVKMLFLFKTEALEHFRRGTDINENNFYEFFAWDFGPFSTQVYDDLTFFMLQEFIESTLTEEESLPESAAEWERWLESTGVRETVDAIEIYQEESFKLLPKGVAFSKRLYDSLSSTQQELLKNFKSRLSTAPLRAILKHVYTQYEDMTSHSKIKDNVLGKHP